MRWWMGSLLAVAVGCDGAATSAVDAAAAPDASDAGADAGRACNDPTTSPVASIDLASWPVLSPSAPASLGDAGATAVTGPPAGVVVSQDGGWVFVASTNGLIGVLQRAGASLTWKTSIATPAGETPFGLALSSDGASLVAAMSDEVGVFDVAKLESGAPGALTATIPTQSAKKTAIEVAVADHFAFVALEYDRAVAVVDLQANAYVGAIPITGDAVTGVALSPDHTRLYVTCEAADEFVAANPSPQTDQIVGAVTVCDVAAAETNPSGAVVGRGFVGRAPVRVAVSPDGATLWITARGSNALVALDAASLVQKTCDPFLSATAVGASPVGLALSADGGEIVVANSNRFAQPSAPQTVSIVGAADALAASPGAVRGRLGVGAFPREVAVGGGQAFVTNFNSSTVSGFDLPP